MEKLIRTAVAVALVLAGTVLGAPPAQASPMKCGRAELRGWQYGEPVRRGGVRFSLHGVVWPCLGSRSGEQYGVVVYKKPRIPDGSHPRGVLRQLHDVTWPPLTEFSVEAEFLMAKNSMVAICILADPQNPLVCVSYQDLDPATTDDNRLEPLPVNDPLIWQSGPSTWIPDRWSDPDGPGMPYCPQCW